MTRWLPLLVSVLVLLPRPAVAAAPPNILLIISDDQAWTDYGFMGHPHVRTPNLDRLADESLLFTRGYVTTSLCCPSLATLITGLYPHQHGITGNEPPLPDQTRAGWAEAYAAERERMDDRIEAVPTLPRLLAERGYLSLQTGKWWHGSYARGGFTHGMTHGDPARGGRHGDEGLRIGREGLQPVSDFLDAAGGRPWFIWYAPFMPHTPHTPPDRLLAKYRDRTDSLPIARYWAMCEWFDETCGELLGLIDQRGQGSRTLVIYVTDNGWINDPAAQRYAPRSKRSPYDGGLRTPIMVRWRGRVEPARVTTPVSSIDIAPTILASAGMTPTPAMKGRNLLDAAAVAARPTVFGAVYLHDALDLDRPVANLTHWWCVNDGKKLIWPNRALVPEDRVELYDVERDALERVDLGPIQPEEVRRRQLLVRAWYPEMP